MLELEEVSEKEKACRGRLQNFSSPYSEVMIKTAAILKTQRFLEVATRVEKSNGVALEDNGVSTTDDLVYNTRDNGKQEEDH